MVDWNMIIVGVVVWVGLLIILVLLWKLLNVLFASIKEEKKLI